MKLQRKFFQLCAGIAIGSAALTGVLGLLLVLLMVPPARDSLIWVFLGLLLAAAAGAGALAFVANQQSKKISEPIASMATAARKMAKGNFEVQVATTEGDDDLNLLADTFNYMSGEVKAARQAQRNFLANVSSDLRTPLTSIQGYSQALMDGAVPSEEQKQRVAGIIYAESVRLSRLLQDLLDLARIEAGRFTMNQRDIDLNALLDTCGERFKPQAEAYGIEFNVQHPRRALPVRGDAERLEQVLNNLVDNAFTSTGNGGHVSLKGALGGVRGTGSRGGAIAAMAAAGSSASASAGASASPNASAPAAEVENEAGNGENGNGEGGTDKLGRWWVEIKISDDGPGYPPEELPHIFERFFRAEQGFDGEGSSGLGLAIARQIVIAHGGDVIVESIPGEGTEFTVRLPMNVGN